MERWRVYAPEIGHEDRFDPRSGRYRRQPSPPCPACLMLEGTAWPIGQGLMPPLHPLCRCHRERIAVDGLGGAALIALALEAVSNVRDAAGLRRRALARIGVRVREDGAAVRGPP